MFFFVVPDGVNTNWAPVSLCAEGCPHAVFGTGAGESQSRAGNKDQPDTPARQETHADGQTGENMHRYNKYASLWHYEPIKFQISL